ncbi:hypothetical protein J132_06878 [Termitomyces sp. J132]|nr:hypothetical protein J132_06878 [Termitomyces sp. J132]
MIASTEAHMSHPHNLQTDILMKFLESNEFWANVEFSNKGDLDILTYGDFPAFNAFMEENYDSDSSSNLEGFLPQLDDGQKPMMLSTEAPTAHPPVLQTDSLMELLESDEFSVDIECINKGDLDILSCGDRPSDSAFVEEDYDSHSLNKEEPLLQLNQQQPMMLSLRLEDNIFSIQLPENFSSREEPPTLFIHFLLSMEEVQHYLDPQSTKSSIDLTPETMIWYSGIFNTWYCDI